MENIHLRQQGAHAHRVDEHILRIFDRFYRCDPARKYQGGYGLGLSIANQIASNLKIKIDVSSEQKKGTTFTLWIPAK